MRSRGFTLIELLIAIGIFALIGLTAYRVLSTVNDTHALLDARTQSLRQLQKAAIVIKKDVLQITDRSVRSGYDEMLPSLTSRGGVYVVEFTRVGWRNPAGNERSQVQRVAYEVKNKQLIRRYWNVLDRAQDTQPREQVLLTGVDSMTVRFMDAQKQWQPQWPLEKTGNRNEEEKEKAPQLPMAVELTVTTQVYGDIRWLFLTGDAKNEAPTGTP